MGITSACQRYVLPLSCWQRVLPRFGYRLPEGYAIDGRSLRKVTSEKAVLNRSSLVLGFLLVSSAIVLEFSADVFLSAQGHTTTSTIFVKDQKFHMEPKGQAGYSIMRGDKQLV